MPESAPPSVEKLLAAANANDTEAFLSMFVEGGVVDDWGRELVGRDAIRGWSDREFIGKHVSLAIRGIEQDGQAVVVTADVGGDGFNGPSHFTFVVDGDPRVTNDDQGVAIRGGGGLRPCLKRPRQRGDPNVGRPRQCVGWGKTMFMTRTRRLPSGRSARARSR